ncbi:hypothetical protein C3Y87_13260 [Carbonactinospora thermoautotrophica]|uniref:Cobalt transporter n=1 Tax=Carbonactinospora thermoautotrophica TaxID=1469144 RepID=A0A132MUX4_9ACTN|nr:CbtB-domain containing protein [Carbonactinospora thermoautotrophica]KWX01172.1 hypothetical protein LI90_2200 [Carbonactinospora thermoautotrophica]KWX05438.1 hypothetical protein TR74_23790 [Carbonactinospora thermoautotrophica]KWX05529.1 hypothetical protein TH66_02330 [Carbonactinospora thermoautotrophica]MCX9192360.1 hypothetical protein [Carbonactinospora thermoautotrophica]
MSTAIPEAQSSPTLAIHPLQDGLIAVAAAIVALIALYAVFLDQGQLLSPVLGKVAYTANYLHEFAHDGRHLLGAPCH